jgi:hypothetical protein
MDFPRIKGGESSTMPANGQNVAVLRNSHNQFARERDARAIDFLAVHPASAAQLVAAAIYPSEKKARERLLRLDRKGKIRCAGRVANRWGQEVKLYATGPVGKPQHEYELTEVLLRIQATEVVRGYGIHELNPDAIITIGPDSYFLELDRGTEGYREMYEQVKAYGDNTVLWIMSSQTRIEGIFRREVPESQWFTTYTQAVDDFHAEGAFENIEGDRATIGARPDA